MLFILFHLLYHECAFVVVLKHCVCHPIQESAQDQQISPSYTEPVLHSATAAQINQQGIQLTAAAEVNQQAI